MKRATRKIDVWEGENTRVEREGNTVAIQVNMPNGQKAKIVIPLTVAAELAESLPDACAMIGVAKVHTPDPDAPPV